MVSFLLNEWRETRNIEEKKIVILKEVQQDLKSDSVYLSYALRNYKKMLRGHDSMMTYPKNGFEIDSITMYLDYLVSYSPFTPSERAYINIYSDPELVINVSDTIGTDYLINKYTIIKTQLYSAIQEWEEIDKNFVLNTSLPYMEEHAPYYPSTKFKLYDGRVFKDISKKDHFKNIVKSGALYKSVLVENYKMTIEVISKLQAEIDTFIKQDLKK